MSHLLVSIRLIATSEWPLVLASCDANPDFSSGAPPPPPKAPKKAAAPRTRSNFPETWLWTEAVTDKEGLTTLTATVPDTITSWLASAFAIHQDTGLGVAERASMDVFQPFFVQFHLPYAVKRNEKMGLQVLVFNYENKDIQVDPNRSLSSPRFTPRSLFR